MRPIPEYPSGLGCRRLCRRAGMAAGMLLALMLVVPAAGAQFDTDDPEAAVWSLDEAVSRVEAHYPGRVLSAREETGEGSVRIFVIRILTRDQEVRTLRIEEGSELKP